MVRTYTLFQRLAEPDRHSDWLARRNIDGLGDSRVTRAAHNEHLRAAQQTDQAEAAVIPRYRRGARHWNLDARACDRFARRRQHTSRHNAVSARFDLLRHVNALEVQQRAIDAHGNLRAQDSNAIHLERTAYIARQAAEFEKAGGAGLGMYLVKSADYTSCLADEDRLPRQRYFGVQNGLIVVGVDYASGYY